MLSVGSKDQTESASVSSSRTPPPDNSNIGHSNKDHNLTSLSRSPQWHGETRECIPHSSVGNYYSMPGNEKPATEAQGFRVSSQFLTESKNNSKPCASDKLSLFKSKAAMSGIKVEEDTDLVVDKEVQSNITHEVVGEEEEPKQAVESLDQIPKTAMKMTDLALTNEASVNNLDHALGSKPLGELDSEVIQMSTEKHGDGEIKSEGETCRSVGEKSESISKVENQEESVCTTGIIQEGKEYDNVTTTENTLNVEHVTVSLKEDADCSL